MMMVPATNTANNNNNNTNATATVNHDDANEEEKEEDDDETKIQKQFELYCEEAARKLLFAMTTPPQSMKIRNNDA